MVWQTFSVIDNKEQEDVTKLIWNLVLKPVFSGISLQIRLTSFKQQVF